MSEIRQDPTTKEWVIIATERKKRPSDFTARTPRVDLPDFMNSCPFCPGNEAMTAPAVLFYPLEQGSEAWRVRVFANKFPAVTPDGKAFQKMEHQLFLSTDGAGYHELIVESPKHNGLIALMDDFEVAEILRSYRDRHHAMSQKPLVKSIVIFKNYGLSAGTSLEHPHSQMIATSIIPSHIRMQQDIAVHYFNDTQRSLYRDLRESELEAGTRIIIDSRKFVVFHPFASHRPFETWIMPKNDQASFDQIGTDDIYDLAQVLRATLLKLYRGLDNPDFNLVVDSSPVGEERSEIYLWHIRIIPRISDIAGFEIGSGIFINTALPEETAPFLRDMKV